MKKSIVALVIASLVVSMAGPVFAENNNNNNDGIPSVPSVPSIESVAPQSENFTSSTIRSDNLTALKARGKNLITQRIRALNRLNQKLDKSKLADTDKASLKAEIASNLSGLAALGAKIAADTDIAVARTDIQSIYTAYRIYAVFLPKINGIMTSVILQQHANLMSATTVAKYDLKIAELKATGATTTEVEALMADAKAKIAEGLAKAKTAQTGFAGLKPADYPATNAVIKTNAQLLKDSRAALKAAEKILVKVRLQLKAVNAKLQLEKRKAELQKKLDERKKNQEEKINEQKKKLEDKQNAQKQKLDEKLQKKQSGNTTGTKK